MYCLFSLALGDPRVSATAAPRTSQFGEAGQSFTASVTDVSRRCCLAATRRSVHVQSTRATLHYFSQTNWSIKTSAGHSPRAPAGRASGRRSYAGTIDVVHSGARCLTHFDNHLARLLNRRRLYGLGG